MTEGVAARSVLSRTAAGMGWIVGWRLATRLLGLASTLILVRVLLPEDFGLVALGAAFAQTIDALSSLGTDDALVREPSPTRSMYDTAFTLNAIRGVLTGSVVALAAVPAGAYFGEPRLAPLLWSLGALAVFDGFVNVGIVDFRRDFQFHKELLLNIVPRLISVVVAVGAALAFQSYWALLAGQATFRLLRVGASYRMHPYRPHASLAAWRGLLLFSAWTWVLSVVQTVQGRVDAFVIGRSVGTSNVGAYALGIEVANLPTSEIVDSLGRAAYSGFSATYREGGTEALFYRLVASAMIVTLPMGLGLSMVADPLVRVALGARWLQVVPVIQIVSLTCGAATVGCLAHMLLRSHGFLHLVCGVSFLGLVAKVATMLALLGPYGLPGAAAGATVSVILESVLLMVIVSVKQRTPFWPLAQRCWRIAAAALAMAAVLGTCGLAWTGREEAFAGSVVRLLGSATLGALAYMAVLWTLWAVQGRPAGAERDMLDTLSRIARTIRGRLAGLVMRRLHP